MSEMESLAMARYWHEEWKAALIAKEFDRAEECFTKANYWKQRADIHGMMGQEMAGGVA